MRKWFEPSRQEILLQLGVLLIPAVGVGLWETYRHHDADLHLHSATAGNLLAAGLVFLLTFVIQRRLIVKMTENAKSLQTSKLENEHLQARELLAAQMHDGMAQSLFLMSVQLEAMEQHPCPEKIAELRKTVRHMDSDVRLTIAQLRQSAAQPAIPASDQLKSWVMECSAAKDWQLEWKWDIPMEEMVLAGKQALDFQGIIREIIWNIYKHGRSAHVKVHAMRAADGEKRLWNVLVSNDHSDWLPDSELYAHSFQSGFGLQLIDERAEMNGWHTAFSNRDHWTTFLLSGSVILDPEK